MLKGRAEGSKQQSIAQALSVVEVEVVDA